MANEILRSPSSPLSSIPSDFYCYRQLYIAKQDSLDKLSNYNAQSPNDDSAKLLRSFIEHLPLDGRHVIIQLVLDAKDDKALRELADHLFTAVLLPCMFKNS